MNPPPPPLMPLTMLDKNATINVTGINISMKVFFSFELELFSYRKRFNAAHG